MVAKMTSRLSKKACLVIASTHFHLNHHNCLKVVILKGQVKKIEKLGNNIASLKGVKLSRMNIIAAEA
jgi:CopG family nickel-responsive transcriptional regulator